MFKEKIKINFYNCDPAGILFYANLFKFAHKIYESFVESFNLNKSYFESNEFVVPITHADGDYFIPMKSGDEIEVSVCVSQIRNSSFELSYKFTDKDFNICAQVKTVHVFVNKTSFKKIVIPPEILIKLESNQG